MPSLFGCKAVRKFALQLNLAKQGMHRWKVLSNMQVLLLHVKSVLYSAFDFPIRSVDKCKLSYSNSFTPKVNYGDMLRSFNF